jgi:hypothetical protein
MRAHERLAVTDAQTLQFFFDRLKVIAPPDATPQSELLYNASLLAHFASTSTRSTSVFPPCPSSLAHIFDVYVLDQSQHVDPAIMEAAGSQCLLLTGFFGAQSRRRHNVSWYAELGAGFFLRAARLGRDEKRSRMMGVMAERFDFWRAQQARLAEGLREERHLLRAELEADAD